MFLFLLKKWFYNCWDNLFRVVAYNIVFTAFVLLLLFLFRTIAFSEHSVISIAVNWIFIAALSSVLYITIAIIAAQAHDIMLGKASLHDLPAAIRKMYFVGSIFGISQWMLISLLLIAIPFYNAINLFIGSVAIGILLWVTLAWLAIIQYFFPLYLQINPHIKPTLRKSAIMFFDNSVFSIGIFGMGIAMFIVSVFTIFMFPGITGILLWKQEACALRLHKYSYLEKNKDADKKHIPWDEILADEREKTGSRSLKSFIFPWKD